jgi:hypothetical protein
MNTSRLLIDISYCSEKLCSTGLVQSVILALIVLERVALKVLYFSLCILLKEIIYFLPVTRKEIIMP